MYYVYLYSDKKVSFCISLADAQHRSGFVILDAVAIIIIWQPYHQKN